MTAILSPCEFYRYRLEREVQDVGEVFAFFGVNPSTADATLDDATVRKWRGFTLRNGGRRFIVGNVFALRSTDPKGLSLVNDPYGPDQREHLCAIINDADVLIPCWGGLSKMPADLRSAPSQLLALMRLSGKPIFHFGLTGCGQPKHPLMLSYDTPLVRLPVWPLT